MWWIVHIFLSFYIGNFNNHIKTTTQMRLCKKKEFNFYHESEITMYMRIYMMFIWNINSGKIHRKISLLFAVL